ncbi:sigma-54-dependent Fis family transcriptional regulator [Vreelandella neptunia]|uniref:Sigma 54-interacting transcriptional regulator n=1 Tax=Vreelandella neptunia TaxID=115551 RepID=A0ABS9S4W7_9GAMM|nr:sigma 54-interacting transcriptional regulator [Halomonas neptunia]MCH4811152.1 sigma 54-interacting transcriptional regulator [Halomonas neptunia]
MNTPPLRHKSQDINQDTLILSEAAHFLGSSLEADTTIPAVLRSLSQLAGLNRGRVVLPDADNQMLRIAYAYGLQPFEKARGIYRRGEGITGSVMEAGRVCVVQNIDEEDNFLFRAVTRDVLPNDVVAFIAVPILLDEMPVGVLACHRLRNRPRGIQTDLHLLRIIAAMIGQMLRIKELIRQRTERLENQNSALRSALERHKVQDQLLGSSSKLKQALDEAIQVANSDATIMLQGESGTGKERFARLIHAHSSRAKNPFVCINCAAIPEHLLEAELFGHEKGAFTGAIRSRAGKVEAANGGTLFLDEIGDMPLELQTKMLRLLQERSLQRVGGDQEIPVDIRVLTATHMDLQQAVNNGEFRLDLFYRLNVVPLRLPPLREREGDVALLAHYFLNVFNLRHDRQLNFDSGVVSRLDSYPWPGNIRQLENVIERAVLTSRGVGISSAHIEHILHDESQIERYPGPNHHVNSIVSNTSKLRIDDAEVIPGRTYAGIGNALQDGLPFDGVGRPYQRIADADPDQLIAVLRKVRGNKTEAARQLGLSPRQLAYRLQKLGIDKTLYR